MLLKGSPAILLELEAGYRGDMAQLANKCRVRSQKPCIQVRTVCQPECTVLDLKLFFIFLLDLSSAINRATGPGDAAAWNVIYIIFVFNFFNLKRIKSQCAPFLKRIGRFPAEEDTSGRSRPFLGAVYPHVTNPRAGWGRWRLGLAVDYIVIIKAGASVRY